MNYLRFSYLIINLSLSGLLSQSIEVKGTIVDNESQHPLAGVNIVVGEFGTTTDETGSFFSRLMMDLKYLFHLSDIKLLRQRSVNK